MNFKVTNKLDEIEREYDKWNCLKKELYWYFYSASEPQVSAHHIEGYLPIVPAWEPLKLLLWKKLRQIIVY